MLRDLSGEVLFHGSFVRLFRGGARSFRHGALSIPYPALYPWGTKKVHPVEGYERKTAFLPEVDNYRISLAFFDYEW